MTMAQPDVLNPHPPEFERFLYASVGKDRNGSMVTVLSTLARLGLDPWAETTDLVTLGHDAARARLAKLLARFLDVPTLTGNHRRVARDLSHLLPDGPAPGARTRGPAKVAGGRPGAGVLIWAALAIIFVLVQVLAFGGSGAGE
jgi:hypothetical protein